MEGWVIVMGGAYGGIVAIRHGAIRAVIWMHRPGILMMVAMLHAWWRLHVDTDAGGPRALGLWGRGRLRGRRGAVM